MENYYSSFLFNKQNCDKIQLFSIPYSKVNVMNESIEFITTINQGVIVIPQQYQGEIEEAQEVQVIIKAKSKNPHQINQLAGKVKAFKNINAVAWQREIRGEWDETRLSN